MGNGRRMNAGAPWLLHTSSSELSPQWLILSHTKYHEMQLPLRHWNVSLWHPVWRAEQRALGATHSHVPFTHVAHGSRT